MTLGAHSECNRRSSFRQQLSHGPRYRIHSLARCRWRRHHRHRSSRFSLRLGGSLDGGAGGAGKLEKSSEGLLLVSVAEESLLLNNLGGVVNVASNFLDGSGGVALGASHPLADAVLGGVL